MIADTLPMMLMAFAWGWYLRTLRIKPQPKTLETEIGELVLEKAAKARSNIKFIGDGWVAGSIFYLKKMAMPT